MGTATTSPLSARAAAISRILFHAGLKRAPKTSWGGGFDALQVGHTVHVYWTQTERVETTEQAYATMREALAPRGYLIEEQTAGCGGTYFEVTRTDQTQVEDVQRALRKAGRFFEASEATSGFLVESCPTDHRLAMVSFKLQKHTSFEGDRDQLISRTMDLYADALEGFGYATHLYGSYLLVGVEGNRHWPTTLTTLPQAQALSELRERVESEGLDIYTRLAPGKGSIFVVKAIRSGIRRVEVFYDELSGLYRVMPRFSAADSLLSSDLTEVLAKLRDELSY